MKTTRVSLLDRVRAAIRRYRMLEPGDKAVIGVSGGPDSAVLLHILRRLQSELCLHIVVAHLDHNVRRGSAQDMRFVERLSASYGFEFHGYRLSRAKILKNGSLEDQLRRHRYVFFKDVCRRCGAKKIVLAHTLDDQAETLLMRLLRGSGLHGLSSMRPSLALGGLEVVRPLIEVSKKDLLAYASAHKLTYRTDPTNTDEAYLRNKIRHSLLPLLEKEYNKNIREVLAGTARTVASDYAALADLAQEALTREAKFQKRRYVVDTAYLASVSVSLRRMMVRLAIERVKGDLRQIALRHWEEIEDLVFRRPLDAQVHLPGGIVVVKNKKYLSIFKR